MVSRIHRRLILFSVVFFIFGGLLIVLRLAGGLTTGSTVSLFDSISHLSLTNDKHNPYQEPKVQPPKEDDHKEEEHKPKELDPCTVLNPLNRGFIDLTSLSSLGNEGRVLSWVSRGYDSGNNYTIGICSSPFKQNHDKFNEIKDGVNSSLVGAYYIENEQYISIGEYATKPKFKGRKLTLTYENGSYCDLVDSVSGKRLRKSTILTFTCDREMMAKAQVLYIGSTNNCNYIFEVRSHHACPTAAKESNLAAVWIFLLIVLAAIGVYFSGGLLYRQMKAKNGSKPSK